MVQAVVFDLGHTIIDFGDAEDTLRATYLHVLDLLTKLAQAERPGADALWRGVPQRIASAITASYECEDLEELDILALFDAALSDLGLHLDPHIVRQIAEMDHRAMASCYVLPPQNLEAIRLIKGEGLKLGLVSNFTLLPDLLRQDLEELGLLDYFDVTVFSSEEKIRKPHPRIYQAILARLDVPAAATVFIGDRLKEDVQGPKMAGMRAILTTQFRQEDPHAAPVPPDAVVASLADVPAILKTWD